jgi:rubrerythrin
MPENETEKILKNAILLEKRGRAFYQKVSDEASNSAVKEFFQMMADEETRHIEALSEQFKAYKTDKSFLPKEYMEKGSQEDVAAKVLTPDTMEQIASAGFEAAAIAAAMNMEKQAIALYGKRAESATDPQEKALYKWLADWESTHSQFLADMDRALTEKIWHDNQFWPF